MMELKIKNFGPITNGYSDNNGFLPLAPVTVLCGPQSTGKSCIAKLFSTLSWIEKALMRGDFKNDYITKYNRFVKYCANQNIQNYFREDTELHYKGEAFELVYKNGSFYVYEKKDQSRYRRLQISYIPAERNLLSSIEHVENLKKLPTTLSWTRDDLYRALYNLNGAVDLPIENVQLVYDKSNKVIKIQSKKGGEKSYKIRLSEASSGIQSVVPFYIVLKSLIGSIGERENSVTVKENDVIRQRVMEILKDDTMTPETRRLLIENINDNSNKALLAIVEEPEQNLYPVSQRNVLYALLEFNKRYEGNHLLLTTHSPFVIDYLTLAIKAQQVGRFAAGCEDLQDKVGCIVPRDAWTIGKDVAVFQIDNEGNISSLPIYDDMPSDENRLNELLAETNDMFNALMDIEEACRE